MWEQNYFKELTGITACIYIYHDVACCMVHHPTTYMILWQGREGRPSPRWGRGGSEISSVPPSPHSQRDTYVTPSISTPSIRSSQILAIALSTTGIRWRNSSRRGQRGKYGPGLVSARICAYFAMLLASTAYTFLEPAYNAISPFFQAAICYTAENFTKDWNKFSASRKATHGFRRSQQGHQAGKNDLQTD